MPSSFLDELERRVLIFDGAMGTSIQARELVLDDFGGHDGCNEYLVVSRPDVVCDIHRSFLAVGCDAVETDTFGANRVVLAEYGLEHLSYQLNKTAAELARSVCGEFSTPDQPRFVVGSMGPGTKLVTLGQIGFDDLVASYREQARGLIDGGADVLIVETCQDILQAKGASIAALDAMKEAGRRLPLMVQVTIETTGTMLLGTEIAAALTTLESFPVDVIGMNCATGPKEMAEHLRHLSRCSSRKISCLPNAGLPENVGGRAHYHLTPDELADWLAQFVSEFGVNIVGGCCGTTPEHLRKVVERLRGTAPKRRQATLEAAVSSLYSPMPLHQQPPPLIVGERTNTNGSRKFKSLLETGDIEGMVALAREQEQEGAHVLDVCTAYVGRDEVRDMHEVVRRFNQSVTIPLMIDSTEWPVIEDALKLIGGKAIINSINLEDGRKKIDKVVPLAKRYGAALVALVIDEEGQAYTTDKKVAIAQRIYKICTGEYGVPPGDLLFDALTFPITTGQADLYSAGLETLNAIRRIKAELPGAGTILGVSNVSFGLAPSTRQVLNSVFLHYAIEAGLDAAIVNASKIIPLFQIDERGRELCRRLIFNEREQGDPLAELMAHYDEKGQGKASKAARESAAPHRTVEERLKQAIIDGRKVGLIEELELARERYAPLDIINNILLDGMKVVGDLFGSGQMQLPFVLQSAEVMKAAVRHLEQFMEKAEGSSRGKIVLATVKGDVHDIGKNLVDIILTNNGYKVYNLGIKQSIENILQAANEHQVDAIGLSGLLVKSTVVMKEDLEELERRGIAVPVICGGAALTRRYVEQDLRALYSGSVFYGQDAFTGLHIMDELCGNGRTQTAQDAGRAATQRGRERQRAEQAAAVGASRSGTAVAEPPAPLTTYPPRPTRSRVRALSQSEIPVPPFLGSRVVTEIPLDEVFPFLNLRALIGTQWQFRKGKIHPDDYERLMSETVYPLLERLKHQAIGERLLEPAVVYGFFRCQSEGDDLIIYRGESADEWLRFHFPRQSGRERLSISDYFAARSTGIMDYVALDVVTAGRKVGPRLKELFASDQYQDYLYLHGLSVETAEALAECWHKRIRRDWGIGGDDSPDIQELFHLHYRGCRWSFGYPACPDLEDQAKICELLEPQRIGVELTENFQLDPEQSTSAIISHHPQATYFNIE